jgi:hypothetical protein
MINEGMKVTLVFDNMDYLFHLIEQPYLSIVCELVHIPQDVGDLYTLRYQDKLFRINPNFSGFIGMSVYNETNN